MTNLDIIVITSLLTFWFSFGISFLIVDYFYERREEKGKRS